MSGDLPRGALSHMEAALALARQSRPSPNPRVGAVVVAGGEIVGRGFHKRPGMPHAEVMALEEAGDAAEGADLYVTLEPCCHHGRTGPCVALIAQRGIARVFMGMIDPDPRISGEGKRYLEEKGIATVLGVAKEQCETLLFGYTTHRTKGRPSVTLKAAMTLDGALAAPSGDSKWISSEPSRQMAHALRADSDAVLVGIETVLKDDPELTVRHGSGEHPTRVVMDSTLRLPVGSKLAKSAPVVPVIVAHTIADADAERRLRAIEGLETLRCEATGEGRVDPADLLEKLGKRGILSLLVEGGALVHGSFVKAGLADRLFLFVAPKILGSGHPWARFRGAASMADALPLADLKATPIGPDILLEAKFPPKQ